MDDVIDVSESDEARDSESVFERNSIKETTPDEKSPYRQIRTYSYHRAIRTPPKINIQTSLSPLKEKDDTSLSNGDLYQEVQEKGVLNDEDEYDTKSISHSSISRNRLSWRQQPKVIDSGILEKMTSTERKRQEAMFELITSEASYLRSLNVLVDTFLKSPEFRSCLTKTDLHHVFSNIEEVRTASMKFNSALVKRKKASSILIDDVCDIVLDFVTSGAFKCYVTYCANESFQQRALLRAMKSTKFVEQLRILEKQKEVRGLPLHSFFILPMQRITRLPLLVDTIRQRCDITFPQYETASKALRETTKLVKTCNEHAKTLQRTELMIQLQSQLEFKSSRSFALVSPNRYLVKRGPMIRWSEDHVFGFKRITRQDIYMFLFNDVLLLAKRKGDDEYSVFDYCYKHKLYPRDVADDETAFVLIIDKNQEGNKLELKLEADAPNTKARWMAAFKNKHAQPFTKTDMQVEVVKSLRSSEEDVASLKVLDVYVILHATPDGWYFGEKISDGCRGWFPSTHCKEILSLKLREHNLQRRRRLMGDHTFI